MTTQASKLGLACFAALIAACSHVPVEDRYPSRVQVLEAHGCKTLHALRSLELGLFKNGFVRRPRGEIPSSFELQESFVSRTPRLVEYTKSDYEIAGKRVSEPYREITNRYMVAACEESGGKLYLMVVRHDPVTEDRFVGARFEDAMGKTGCEWKAVSAPRELRFYRDSTEEDLLRYVRRGRCRDYAAAN